MGVQKSKCSSVHKYNILFFKIKKKKKTISISKKFNQFKFITKFAHLTNLLLECLIRFKIFSFFELFFQLFIVYNLIQLFKQSNFFFVLAYFLNFVLFVGLSMIFCDLDLGAIILWIIYGGVIIIFFLYATMWSETVKSNVFFFDYRLGFFLFYVYIFYIFMHLITDFKIIEKNWIIDYIDIYMIFDVDTYEELEMLGASFFFFSLFYFILCTIALVISCFSIVVIISYIR